MMSLPCGINAAGGALPAAKELPALSNNAREPPLVFCRPCLAGFHETVVLGFLLGAFAAQVEQDPAPESF